MALGAGMNIIQIAGHSNSGKTTLIEQLIKRLKEINLTTSVIKHHGHAKKLAALDRGKDSAKYRDAGAVGSTVVAGNVIQMQFSSEEKWSIEEAIQFNKYIKRDVVIIEGFKNESYKKIVMIREERDLVLLEKLENIIAVITWGPTISSLTIPTFFIEDLQSFFEWFIKQYLEGKG